ncbi:MAG: hypothetical protein J0M24_26125 [Verrucomicrobia bacterium]|nr:hypothetical protein [Verrucomicrobiota bacterium]
METIPELNESTRKVRLVYAAVEAVVFAILVFSIAGATGIISWGAFVGSWAPIFKVSLNRLDYLRFLAGSVVFGFLLFCTFLARVSLTSRVTLAAQIEIPLMVSLSYVGAALFLRLMIIVINFLLLSAARQKK